MAQLRKFSKVLVAVDGSEYSMNAAEYAISITKVYGSQLIALHVITSDVSTIASTFSPQMEEIKKILKNFLIRYGAKVKQIGIFH